MPETLDPSDLSHADYLVSTNGFRAVPIHFSDVPLFESTINELLELLESNKNEVCGFITDLTQTVVCVENIHEFPRDNFYMEKEDFEQSLEYIYNDLQEEVLGVWHTHPNNYPWPSPRDLRGWPNSRLNWRYFLVSRGDVTEWGLVRD